MVPLPPATTTHNPPAGRERERERGRERGTAMHLRASEVSLSLSLSFALSLVERGRTVQYIYWGEERR